jgi:regulator of sigma D
MDKKAYLGGLERVHDMIKRIFREIELHIDGEKILNIKPLVEELEGLKAILIEHTRNEDERFYDELSAKAKETGQNALLPALDLYVETMVAITDRCVKFFDSFPDEASISSNEVEFIKRFSAIRDEVTSRIKSEEGSLFHIYKAYFF